MQRRTRQGIKFLQKGKNILIGIGMILMKEQEALRSLSDGRVVSKKHWKVDGIDFHDPLMPKAPKELLSDEYTQVRRDLQVANRRFDRISVFLGEAETGELNKAMKKEMRKIRGSMTKLSRMIPVNQLPKDATIDNLLASECKQLIRLINQIDENANLALSGNVNEP